jgi:putative transposase
MSLKRYSGGGLRVRGNLFPGLERVARLGGAWLSPVAKRRLEWIDWYRRHGENARRTCRHFSISPDTFYRWLRRYSAQDLTRLESKSHRPWRLRQPTWGPKLAREVLNLREQYPRWGKDKLVVLLRRRGWQVSASMVGRIIKSLKSRGLLHEPPRKAISAKKRRWTRPYAIRKPKEYQALLPGDLVELDTLDVRPLPGIVLKHFTARDVVSRWDVLEVHRRATSTAATAFLEQIQQRMPFPVRALQVDGGSEFAALFEEACRQRNIRLFVLPPRSPKLNGSVERAQRTHTEEFYEIYQGTLQIPSLNRALKKWEDTYNQIRPHQSLHYLTPSQYLQAHPPPQPSPFPHA